LKPEHFFEKTESFQISAILNSERILEKQEGRLVHNTQRLSEEQEKNSDSLGVGVGVVRVDFGPSGFLQALARELTLNASNRQTRQFLCSD
jgi:hypothetical protein